MRVDILTLFPDSMRTVLGESIIGRGVKNGHISIHAHQIRDYTENKQMQVDDYPYGGGFGCVMMAQPLKSCLDDVMQQAGERRSRVIYMSPQGRRFNQEEARRLVRDYDHLVLVCGHYEGIDERFIEECVDEELSIGDFVLTGGELAAMVVTDAVCRMVPGVLSDEACYTGESHWDGLLEYPQYTRPDVWEGRAVPEVLRSGDHAKVDRWRRKKQLERTMDKRPDMWSEFKPVDKTDIELLEEIKKERSRMRLEEPVTFHKATSADLPAILDQAVKARSRMKKQKINFGTKQDEQVFKADVENGSCYVVRYGNAFAGMFSVVESDIPFCEHTITDGRWHGSGKHVVLRRLAVENRYSGTGMADIVMGFAEQVAREKGAVSIRVPVHKKNVPMKKLLNKHNYRYRGNIDLAQNGNALDLRQAFEKML
ncbi:MAG: tRNA (guanosine(37)-N1)-methyltransferase TrmD [Oscillospiraceae bacterium]|nr:tRNA (guanosine(37)-N1)-methyltransferase TrmD [Oscillospiraceae bacterium]